MHSQQSEAFHCSEIILVFWSITSAYLHMFSFKDDIGRNRCIFKMQANHEFLTWYSVFQPWYLSLEVPKLFANYFWVAAELMFPESCLQKLHLFSALKQLIQSLSVCVDSITPLFQCNILHLLTFNLCCHFAVQSQLSWDSSAASTSVVILPTPSSTSSVFSGVIWHFIVSLSPS